MPIKVNCNFCEKELLREPNQIRTRKHHYCDCKCLANSKKNKVELKCDFCNESIVRAKSSVDGNSTGKFFCSSNHRGLYYKQAYHVNCVICEKKFEKVLAEQKRYPIHCCSIECRSKYNDRRELRKCDECGGKIFRPPSVMKNRDNLFCSIKCHDAFQNHKTEVKCEKCGKKVWKSPCAMGKRHYFCSRECFSKYTFSESFVETEFENLIKPLGLSYVRNDRKILHGCAKHGGGLELDFYFPDIKFAVEVNGGCHYIPIYGEEALAGQKVRDQKKRRRCIELGIILRVVKPGDCKRETYLPRYRRVIWEMKRLNQKQSQLS